MSRRWHDPERDPKKEAKIKNMIKRERKKNKLRRTQLEYDNPGWLNDKKNKKDDQWTN